MLTSDDDGLRAVLTISGNFDVYTSPAILKRLGTLLESGPTHIVINLENVAYIDSTGLGALLKGLHKARSLGGTLLLVTRDPQVKRIFAITGLCKVFAMFDDVKTALTSSGAPFERSRCLGANCVSALGKRKQ